MTRFRCRFSCKQHFLIWARFSGHSHSPLPQPALIHIVSGSFITATRSVPRQRYVLCFPLPFQQASSSRCSNFYEAIFPRFYCPGTRPSVLLPAFTVAPETEMASLLTSILQAVRLTYFSRCISRELPQGRLLLSMAQQPIGDSIQSSHQMTAHLPPILSPSFLSNYQYAITRLQPARHMPPRHSRLSNVIAKHTTSPINYLLHDIAAGHD